MPSDNLDDATLRATRAFLTRLCRIGLPNGLARLDVPEAMMLAWQGITRIGPSIEPTIEALESSADLVGEDLAGPFWTIPRQDQLGIFRLRDLLLDSRARVRALAVGRVRALGDRRDLASSHVVSEINRRAADICSDQPSRWREAALDSARLLQQDWLLNLAGMRQCAETRCEDGWRECLDATLQPTIAACMWTCPPELCRQIDPAATDGLRDELTRLGVTEADFLHRYLKTLGHLPLESDYALNAFIQRSSGEDRPKSMTALIAAAKVSGSAIAQILVVTAALANRAALSEPDWSLVSTWFWEHLLPADQVKDPSNTHVLASVTVQIAQYFEQYLELRLPADQGEAVSALAWWMTLRFEDALHGSANDILEFAKTSERIHFRNTLIVWSLVGPAFSWSYGRQLTLSRFSPYTAAAICGIKRSEDLADLLESAGPGNAEERRHALLAFTMGASSPRLGKHARSHMNGLRQVMVWFAEADPTADGQEAFVRWAEGDEWSDDQAWRAKLGECHTSTPVDQTALCFSLQRLMEVGEVSGDAVWAIVAPSAWGAGKWAKLPIDAIHALATGLSHWAACTGAEWRFKLPHLIAEIAELRADSEDDRQRIFELLLKTCSSLAATSAIISLLKGRAATKYAPLAVHVRSFLETLAACENAWAAGRLRHLLVALTC